jgi:isopentenyl-diphosphate delta-isomerase
MVEENESVILVNESDEPVGTAPKLDAHRNGQLHRAFSVFISDDNGRILLHRRASHKYHSGGLWTNACCGHPRPGEVTREAAKRRLWEELRIDCELSDAAVFTYRAGVGSGLTEHELDHVFTGFYAGDPSPDSEEVDEWQWISPDDLNEWIADDPSVFTVWFERALYASGLGTIRSSTFADERTPGTPPPG